MKITLDPGGTFPPSPIVAANIRKSLETASVTVGSDAPILQPGSSITAWFDPITGDVKFYEGINQITFRMRNAIVSTTAPTDPVNGTQWLNANDGGIYTWYQGVWIAGDAALPFGADDLLALMRASIISDTPPLNPTEGQQWFRTDDGYTYTWYQGAWVAGEASFANDLQPILEELEQKASKRFTIVTISDPDSEVLPTHADAYVRFTGAAVKTYTIPLGVDIEEGTAITLRNVGANTLTILAASGVTMDFAAAANILASKSTAQLLNVGLNTWDLI